MKLYYYSDLNGHSGWFADAASFRKAFPQATLWIRTSHVGIPAPTGYVKLEGDLAFAPAVMVRGRGRTYYKSLLTANTQSTNP